MNSRQNDANLAPCRPPDNSSATDRQAQAKKSIIFFSYSHKDESTKDFVTSHLQVAEQQGILELWNDRSINGGTDWRSEIDSALARADIAVLLASRHSLTSKFILDHEVSALLQRRSESGLIVFPIVASACDWEAVPWLSAMNLRPKDGKPLDTFTRPNRNMVMAEIAREIRAILASQR